MAAQQHSHITVHSETKFLGMHEDGYAFAYQITIRNHGPLAVQLLSRHWVITHGSGQIEEVNGDGVVGEQPRLQRGEQFTYTSGAVLQAPTGSMRGEYLFTTDDGDRFEVPIPEFALIMPSAAH